MCFIKLVLPTPFSPTIIFIPELNLSIGNVLIPDIFYPYYLVAADTTLFNNIVSVILEIRKISIIISYLTIP